MKNDPQPKPEPLLFDELLSRCMGETDFAKHILKDFLTSCSPLLDEIMSEPAEVDRTQMAKKIHRLKGTAATVGAKPFKESLLELEAILKECEEDAARLPELSGALVKCSGAFETVQIYIENELLN